MAQAEPLPVVTAVPRRLRRVCVGAGLAIIAAFLVIAFLLKDSAIGTEFTTADQVGIGGLGVLIAAGIGLLGRPSVRADAKGIHVQNIVVSHDLPWQVVRAVRFGDGAPWATLDLEDDEEISVLAVQAVDREYAVSAMRGLRALHAAAQQGADGERGPELG